MTPNERRYITVTGKFNILKVLDLPARYVYDNLLEQEVDMLNVVCYNVPISILPNAKNKSMRILAGSTIIDIDNLDTTFREHLPAEEIDGEKLTHICAFLMTVREIKKNADEK